jgi:hypothetical protein
MLQLAEGLTAQIYRKGYRIGNDRFCNLFPAVKCLGPANGSF